MSRPRSSLLPAATACALAACVSAPPPAPAPLPAGPAAPFAPQAAAEPGGAHRALDPLVGLWEVEVQAATGELLARGAARIAWEPSGRFLRWEAELGSEELRSRSTGLLGHDAAAGEYQWVWASGWSGRISLARGRGELGGGGLRLVADETDPASGRPVRARSVLRLVGDERIELEQALETAPGVWRGTTRTTYRRASDLAEGG